MSSQEQLGNIIKELLQKWYSLQKQVDRDSGNFYVTGDYTPDDEVNDYVDTLKRLGVQIDPEDVKDAW